MWVTSLGYYRLPSGMVWVSPRQDEVRRGQVWTMGVEQSEQRDSAAWVSQGVSDPEVQEGRVVKQVGRARQGGKGMSIGMGGGQDSEGKDGITRSRTQGVEA